MRNLLSGAASFVISCIAAGFVFGLAAAIAANPEFFFGESVFGYNSDTGILRFLGEDYFLTPGAVERIAAYPCKAADFVLSFFPQAAVNAAKRLFLSMTDYFLDFASYGGKVVGEFFMIGVK